MPYDWVWTKFLFRELASLAFYVFTGFKFQPRDENPYLHVSKEDDENASEFGLDEDEKEGGIGERDVEITTKSRASA